MNAGSAPIGPMSSIVSSTRNLNLQSMSNNYDDRQISPDRADNSKLDLGSNGGSGSGAAIVPVIYYLSRNGQLDHPHFVQVPLSSSQGLFLTDVVHRLNSLRGKGMANHYSWSAKRRYKNCYVWHDLEENDFIYPIRGQEYVLKGSEILESSANLLTSKLSKTASSSSVKQPEVTVRSQGLNTAINKEKLDCRNQDITTELSREEISPPLSDSSPETLESLMNLDAKLAFSSSAVQDANPMATEQHLVSGAKIKPASILMSLISCGSNSFRDLGGLTIKGDGLDQTTKTDLDD